MTKVSGCSRRETTLRRCVEPDTLACTQCYPSFLLRDEVTSRLFSLNCGLIPPKANVIWSHQFDGLDKRSFLPHLKRLLQRCVTPSKNVAQAMSWMQRPLYSCSFLCSNSEHLSSKPDACSGYSCFITFRHYDWPHIKTKSASGHCDLASTQTYGVRVVLGKRLKGEGLST